MKKRRFHRGVWRNNLSAQFGFYLPLPSTPLIKAWSGDRCPSSVIVVPRIPTCSQFHFRFIHCDEGPAENLIKIQTISETCCYLLNPASSFLSLSHDSSSSSSSIPSILYPTLFLSLSLPLPLSLSLLNTWTGLLTWSSFSSLSLSLSPLSFLRSLL